MMNKVLNYKIVIIEDDPVYLDYLYFSIKELSPNIEIINALDGEDGFIQIKKWNPDLIICDWDLPKMDGIKLTEKIRNTNSIKHIPIIMCTGKNKTPENLKYAFSKGVSDFISKPLNQIEFFARVKSQLTLNQYYQTIIKQKEEILIEKEKSDKLIKNILPESIANELKNNGYVKPKLFKNVTVYFSDIVNFTKKSKSMNLVDLIDELNQLYSVFDEIMIRNNCERVKTVGDAYIAVCGMHIPNKTSTKNIIKSAKEILSFLKLRNSTSKFKWEIRTGIHNGDIIGGIVGTSKFRYDIFGDTINITSRLEKSSKPMQILISADAYQKSGIHISELKSESINVNGIGLIDAYSLED